MPRPRPGLTREQTRRLRSGLLRWYRRHRRDLPWRRTHDPYAIWVSEVMLQQTQVATVVPYYRRFVERFPDVTSLARAPEEAVLSVWSGLGYYRRARALHAAARMVVERYRGRVPDDPVELRSLPGIGRYTAGAISSVGYGREEPVLDGNVKRVLARLHADSGRREAGLWEIAAALVRGRNPGDLNQALMELGALVCTPRAPSCRSCPAKGMCRSFALGRPEAYPERAPVRPVEHVRVAVALTRRGGRILLERPRTGSPLRGSWDLPAVTLDAGVDAARTLARALRQRHGVSVTVGGQAGSARHAILHRRLALEAFECRWIRGRKAAADPNLRWILPRELDDTPVSGATRKLLAAASANQPR